MQPAAPFTSGDSSILTQRTYGPTWEGVCTRAALLRPRTLTLSRSRPTRVGFCWLVRGLGRLQASPYIVYASMDGRSRFLPLLLAFIRHIPPSTTSLSTVHRYNMVLKLYGSRWSPNAKRVAMVLREKEVSEIWSNGRSPVLFRYRLLAIP